MLRGILDALTSRQSENGVDVQPLIGEDTCGTLYLPGLQLPPHNHEDVAVLALMAHPVLILIVADGREADVHVQLRSLEEQFLHHLSGVVLTHANQDTQRECGVDVRLSDVEDLCVVLGKDAHNGCGQSGTILSRNPDEYLFLFLFCFHDSILQLFNPSILQPHCSGNC